MAAPDELAQATTELREFAKVGLRDSSFSRRMRLLEDATVLAGLPAIRDAGHDATTRFAYLVQAITDAIDDLSATGEEPHGRIDRTHPEATALRLLFGLTDETRRAAWRPRQDAAAASMHVSWDHFRHRMQDPLLRAVAERLLANTSEQIKDLGPPVPLTAYASQRDVEAAAIAYIHANRPVNADLIELSTATILPILQALRDVGTNIRLLVADPARYSAGWQRGRTVSAIADLLSEFDGYSTLHMRVYSVPPSLRGRRIGSLVLLGWYTYRDNKRLGAPKNVAAKNVASENDATDNDATEIWGHDNALISGDASDPSGATLATWFGREFERLWVHRSTQDGSALDLP